MLLPFPATPLCPQDCGPKSHSLILQPLFSKVTVPFLSQASLLCGSPPFLLSPSQPLFSFLFFLSRSSPSFPPLSFLFLYSFISFPPFLSPPYSLPSCFSSFSFPPPPPPRIGKLGTHQVQGQWQQEQEQPQVEMAAVGKFAVFRVVVPAPCERGPHALPEQLQHLGRHARRVRQELCAPWGSTP